MKIVYIAHPIAGDVEANLSDLRRIIRKINLEIPDIVPFVPYYSDVCAMQDAVTSERSRGFKNNMEYFERGFIDEVWLTGGIVSGGMQVEVEKAQSYFIPVFYKFIL